MSSGNAKVGLFDNETGVDVSVVEVGTRAGLATVQIDGFSTNLDMTTDISTPGTIIETDGTKTLTTIITNTTITEEWS